VFGLVGLIVGPVIASVALALLQTYDREICNEQGVAVEPPK
jgi:predicted PurR-regulated permease PerM